MTDSDPSVMQAGFLPLFPYPVTGDATVYIVLKNILNGFTQLKRQNACQLYAIKESFKSYLKKYCRASLSLKNILPMIVCMIMYKSLRILQWEAFLRVADVTDFSRIKDTISKLKTCLKYKEIKVSKQCLADVMEIISPFKIEFDEVCVNPLSASVALI